jgi:heme oxygenase
MQVEATTHMERLKAGIWDIHEGVTSGEKQPAPEQDNIMKGTLPRFKYVNNLKQRYLLQGGFEEVLRSAASTSPFVAAVVTDEQFHVEKSATDLRFFGVDPTTVKPLPATTAMIEFFHSVAREDVRLVLAIHYVIEGSNNGAMYIARAVKQAYNLEGTDGTFHLQPYGPEIRDKWKAFVAAFNLLEIDSALMARMIVVGREAFHHMNAVGAASHQVPESAA